MRVLGVLAVALVIVPAAGAWTRVGSGLSNTNDPAVISGPVVAYSTGSSLVAGNGDSMKTLISGAPFVGDPQLVRTDAGIWLFVGTAQGVVRYAGTQDGLTWSGPSAPIPGSRVDDVQGIASDGGLVWVSQDGTDFVDLWNANGGGFVGNLFPYCCGYGESLAVDTSHGRWISFWSNATGRSGYLFGPFGGPYTNLSGGADTVPHSDRVPLVADATGNVYTAWASGYPTAQTLYVDTFRGGAKTNQVALGGGFGGGDPHVALAVDARNRVWAVWSGGGRVHAAQSCSGGATFGRQTSVRAPGTVYAVEAEAEGSVVNAWVNDGSALQAQVLLAGLTVKRTRKVAVVLNDECPVVGALLRGGGHSARTKAQGVASLRRFRRHTLVRVTAPGYAATTFRVP